MTSEHLDRGAEDPLDAMKTMSLFRRKLPLAVANNIVLTLKLALICLAGGLTIYCSESVVVGAAASTLAGCACEIIDANCAKHDEHRLDEIEEELDELRKG